MNCLKGNRNVLAARAILVVVACFFFAANASAESVIERPELDAVIREHGVAGTFVLLDVAADQLTLVNRARAERRAIPASTFKIANSLIALETGAVKDENEILPYGGKPQPIKEWERDMGLRDAIRISNVPVYQEVARRIGLARMQAMIERLGYGNREIGTVVDRFWLDGPLQISPVEQARFVARLARRQLPLSSRSQMIVRDIIRLEERDGATLYGKTGWAGGMEPNIGWLVGWVERGDAVHSFALNIDMAAAQDAPKRMAIVRGMLSKLGVM
jgi:beta-lactamase class D